MLLRFFGRDHHGSGDLGPAMIMLAFMLLLMLILASFDSRLMTSMNTVGASYTPSDTVPFEQENGSSIETGLRIGGYLAGGAAGAIGGTLVFPGLGTVVGALIGIVGAWVIDQAAQGQLQEAWNFISGVFAVVWTFATWDFTVLKDIPLLRFMFMTFNFIIFGWIGRRLILG